ncbi:transcriptional regulator, AlpA family [Nitratireductor indicus]|nr:transcriptional regulator, AlpA family [Nitratireductor indicus]
MKFLKMNEVVQRIGLNKASIYRLMAAGEFPRSVKISEIRVAWIESEVDAWMAERVAARDERIAA